MGCDKCCWKRSLFPSFLPPLNHHVNALTAWHNSAIIITASPLLGLDRSQIGFHHRVIMLTNNNFSLSLSLSCCLSLHLSVSSGNGQQAQASRFNPVQVKQEPMDSTSGPSQESMQEHSLDLSKKDHGYGIWSDTPPSTPIATYPAPHSSPPSLVIYLLNNSVLC